MKYWKQKWGHLVRDEWASSKREQEEKMDKAGYPNVGPSQEQEEEERQTLRREKKEQKLTNEVPTTDLFPWVSCEMCEKTSAAV